jgi:hypothetical protein
MAKTKTKKNEPPRDSYQLKLHYKRGDSQLLVAKILPFWVDQVREILDRAEREQRQLERDEVELVAQAIGNKLDFIAHVLVPLAGCGLAEPEDAATSIEIFINLA